MKRLLIVSLFVMSGIIFNTVNADQEKVNPKSQNILNKYYAEYVEKETDGIGNNIDLERYVTEREKINNYCFTNLILYK